MCDYYLRDYIAKKIDVVSKNDLDDDVYFDGEHYIMSEQVYKLSDTSMIFFKIKGISNYWHNNDKFNVNSIMSDLLCGLNDNNVSLCYIIQGDENGLNIKIGINESYAESLKSLLDIYYPNIHIEKALLDISILEELNDGGILTGIPSDKIAEDNSVNLQIDNLCRGMLGQKFIYVIFAKSIQNNVIIEAHDRLMEELSLVYEYINETINENTVTVSKQSFIHNNYFEKIKSLESIYDKGLERGMWNFTCYFAAEDVSSTNMLSNILKSSFSGNDSNPEKIRTLRPFLYDDICNLIKDANMINIHYPYDYLNPVFDDNNRIYLYQTTINSDQLGILCSLPIKEYPGYFVDEYVEFDTAYRNRMDIKEPVNIGKVVQTGNFNESIINNQYFIDKNDYTRHCLIIGITGGGKTNTSKSMLINLWNKGKDKKVPFLVIESAKREYWELRNIEGFEKLAVYTLGSEDPESSVRYRINPFEVHEGISIQSHIDFLLATFKTAFELYPPMPYVLEQAVYAIYNDRGWDIVTNKNNFGLKLYPTLSDLYDKIEIIVRNMGYHEELESNVRTALEARINSLMIGGKGAMMNTSKSIPIEELLSYPTILELEDIGDDETKSFVIGILLVQLYEYRKFQKSNVNGSKKLQHILMIEEAHRLLKNVSESANPLQAKAIEFFCNMLAEIRTYGQGIFIADQIPTKLAPDTIKNTNLKIVHRTVAKDDRETIGMSMNMNHEQINYLSSLSRGYAAVYSEGDNKPKCVKFPLVESKYNFTRREVISNIKNNIENKFIDDFKNIHCGCCFCEKKCFFHELKIVQKLDKRVILTSLIEHNFDNLYIDKYLTALEDRFNLGLNDIFRRICVLGYFLQYCNLGNGSKKDIISSYIQYHHYMTKR